MLKPYLIIENTMILKEIHELTREYLERKKQLESLWASKLELQVLESEIKFKIDVILNWVDYKLMQQ